MPSLLFEIEGKQIDIPPFDEYGEPNVHVIDPQPFEISKVANTYSYPKELTDYLLNNIKPDPRYMFLLVNGVGAFEFYGANRNGDGFPERNLLEFQDISETRDGNKPIERYRTFELYAKLFKHHKKKNRENNYGDILRVFYDHKMHRILLVVKLIKDRAPDIVFKIENGYIVSVSMGCKVPFDICNICGNQARTKREYCDHLKNQMNEIYFDGRVVCAINTKPRFDDLSFVLLPAWEAGRVLVKVAKQITCSPDQKYCVSCIVKESILKESDIDKEVPAHVLGNISKLKQNEPMVTDNDLSYIAQQFPLKKILASFYMMGMQPKPQELQKIILTKTGNLQLLRELEKNAVIFNENFPYKEVLTEKQINKLAFGPNDVDYQICRTLYEYIPTRSVFGKHLDFRLSKVGEYVHDIPPVRFYGGTAAAILPLAAFFAGAMTLFKYKGLNVGKFFPSFVKANSWLIPALIGGGALLSATIAEEPPSRRTWPNVGHEKAAQLLPKLKAMGSFIGKGLKYGVKHPAALLGAGALPAAYLGAGYIQAKRSLTGRQPGPLLQFAERHPFMLGTAVAVPSWLRYMKTIMRK